MAFWSAAMMLSGCGDTTYYNGPVSDHFDGERFYNPANPMPPKGFRDMLRWRLGLTGPEGERTARAEWPAQVAVTPTVPVERVNGQNLRVTFVGHATFLIQTQGLNILTDPVWSERASPFSWIGPKRVTAPGVLFDDLPKIDIVLVSHNHYDHLDVDTLRRVWERDQPRIITLLGNDTIIKRGITGTKVPVAVEAYDWGQQTAVDDARGLAIDMVPVQHWSARWLNDRRKALWGGFVIRAPGGAIFFAGDTGYGGGWWSKPLKEAYANAGGIRLAILPVGAYAPEWFMRYGHMNPDEAVQALLDTGAPRAIGGHWAAFQLTNEPFYEPMQRLQQARAAAKLDDGAFVTPMPGGIYEEKAASSR